MRKKKNITDFRSEKLYREIKASKAFGGLAEYLKEHKLDIIQYSPPTKDQKRK